MPIHLHPVSRRSFLKQSLVAGAGLLASPMLFAASRKSDAHAWVMMTDPHIAADPTQLGRGMNMTDHLTQVCGEVLALEKAPAGVIVHGDCAFSTGKLDDYEQFLKLMRPLRENKLPIHLALGNHDHRERFYTAANLKASSAVPDKYVSVVKSERANFFILDSLNEIPSNPGLLGEKQLQWLAKNLDANKKKPAIVVVHHNEKRMIDSDKLIALMDERKHVKALFHGHIHRWRLDETPGGVHIVNLLPVGYPTATGGATGWVHATFAADGVRLEVRCTNQEDPLHRTVHQLSWRSA
ncbi:MAG: metallophosphoesterase [Verrucomicrobia bacterium]|nr:metallophosphoesterase [Verrucomicrobiota bacterium]